MKSLRLEIIESQKERTNLIKWKLIMIAALGGTGLGFTKSGTIPNAEYILCCIAIVCAYADIQCRNLSLRIFGISIFLRTIPVKESEKSYFAEYGDFLEEVRKKAFEKGGLFKNQTLESLVIVGTSILLSIILLLYAIIRHESSSIAIGVSAICGILFAIWLYKNFQKRSMILKEVGNNRITSGIQHQEKNENDVEA